MTEPLRNTIVVFGIMLIVIIPVTVDMIREYLRK